ncbi:MULTISPECIES: hypothetical protein [Desulfococcus]|uniref:Uncharacterized protein n=1 Tax=Desulfococcus multivorans DSM 2059 TaxID=1121405 RepID=S7V5E4_DESML|nr:hypothetical protein [Desulfococcus multivorans]AOY56864.1 uncharacterized protein Dmul_00880 [Desulfococcus multivorans]AQU99405.1 hypothetical protein B2D07_00445 [Desulfococcus multivorans]EPR41879.1 hypothetical protein dsmv_1878 [Desulfococcus multivorans DSM 2059]SJZ93688.1 hypothetical protein SAMN02745446_02156 [Desulfococcus multivorans DSM 2059]
MEWLEIIKVRMGGTGDQGIDARYLKEMKRSLTAPSLVGARVYANLSVSNDLMIILTWMRAIPIPWGSDLARGLTQELKRFGLVDYAAWARME